MTVPGWLIYRTIWRSDMLRLIDVLKQRKYQLFMEIHPPLELLTFESWAQYEPTDDDIIRHWPY